MRSLIEWLLARRYRLILLAVALAPFLTPVSMALLALDTARRGVNQGMMGAGIALGGTMVLAVLTGSNVVLLAALGGFAFLSGVLIGAMLLRSGHMLALSFQWLLLIAAGGIVLLGLGGGDSRGMLGPAIDQVIETLRDAGADAQQVQLLIEWQHIVLGLLVALIFVQLVIALLLSHWWSAIAAGEQRFGPQFREFRLARQIGLASMLIVALALVLDFTLVQNLLPLALFAFLFQGLSVLHAWAYARQWHWMAVAPVYVLLVSPLMTIAVMGLSSVGLVDNLFDLRAPLRPSA